MLDMPQIDYIAEIFYVIRQLFSGNYEVQNKENDLPNTKHIPTYSDDRENLRKDRAAIGSDFKKAVKEKNLEFFQQ